MPSWKSYFFSASDKAQAHFSVEVEGEKKTLAELSNLQILGLRDYTLSVIEIDFDDTTSLDEIISLFVDINQQGVPVNRFDIVKALYRTDPLLQQVFRLVALRQKRREDVRFKMIKSNIPFVLSKLDIVSRIITESSRIDKMWERLFEFALFCRSGQHRKPVEILKEFIRSKKTDTVKLSPSELGRLNHAFKFIANGYRQVNLSRTRWATDQTHFYILVTSILNIASSEPRLSPEMYPRLLEFDEFLGGKQPPKKVREDVKSYIGLSSKQTTDPAKRKDREALFVQILQGL